MDVSSSSEFWWDHKRSDQANLWDSWIELGEKFYEAVTLSSVPVDLRALKALKRSPLALDLYRLCRHAREEGACSAMGRAARADGSGVCPYQNVPHKRPARHQEDPACLPRAEAGADTGRHGRSSLAFGHRCQILVSEICYGETLSLVLGVSMISTVKRYHPYGETLSSLR